MDFLKSKYQGHLFYFILVSVKIFMQLNSKQRCYLACTILALTPSEGYNIRQKCFCITVVTSAPLHCSYVCSDVCSDALDIFLTVSVSCTLTIEKILLVICRQMNS